MIEDDEEDEDEEDSEEDYDFDLDWFPKTVQLLNKIQLPELSHWKFSRIASVRNKSIRRSF